MRVLVSAVLGLACFYLGLSLRWMLDRRADRFELARGETLFMLSVIQLIMAAVLFIFQVLQLLLVAYG